MDIQMPKDIGCKELLSDFCTFCGWLRKEPELKFLAWRKIYCVIYDRCFYYYKNETSKKPMHKFPLYGFNKVKRYYQDSVDWSFILEHVQANQKSYKFCASSEQEMVEWMKHIKNEMLRANNREPRTSAAGSSGSSVCSNDQNSLMRIEEKIYDDVNTFEPGNMPNWNPNESFDTEDAEIGEQEAGQSMQRFQPLILPKRSPGDGQSDQVHDRYEHVRVIASRDVHSGKDYWESIYFHGDKDEATKIIENIAKDGVFLIRNSDNVEAPLVLVTYSENQQRAKKFKIFTSQKHSNIMYYMKKDSEFESVEELIFYYIYNSISTEEIFKLTEPYLFAK